MEDMPQIKIIDLNDDCLEFILNKLTLNDLVNITDTNSRFKISACRVFDRKYAKDMKKVVCGVNHFKMLLYFGNNITNLNVCGKTDSLKTYKYDLNTYINVSCVQKYMNHQIKENQPSFSCVRKLNLFGFFNDEIPAQLDTWCPNLICLKLSVVRFQDSRIIDRRIPLLKHLTIQNAITHLSPEINHNFFSNQHITSAIKLNPSLVSLSLNHDGYGIGIEVNGDILNFINREMPNLEKLELRFQKNTYFSDYTSDRIVFTNLRKFSAIFPDSYIIHHLPVSFENLYELKIMAKDTATSHSVDFIRKNQKLLKFELIFEQMGDSYCFIDGEQIMQLAKELPELEIVFIQTTSFSAQEMLHFLLECKRLKQFVVIIVRSGFMCFLEEYLNVDSIQFDTIKAIQKYAIENDWNLTIMYENIDGVWHTVPKTKATMRVKFSFSKNDSFVMRKNV